MFFVVPPLQSIHSKSGQMLWTIEERWQKFWDYFCKFRSRRRCIHGVLLYYAMACNSIWWCKIEKVIILIWHWRYVSRDNTFDYTYCTDRSTIRNQFGLNFPCFHNYCSVLKKKGVFLAVSWHFCISNMSIFGYCREILKNPFYHFFVALHEFNQCCTITCTCRLWLTKCIIQVIVFLHLPGIPMLVILDGDKVVTKDGRSKVGADLEGKVGNNHKNKNI